MLNLAKNIKNVVINSIRFIAENGEDIKQVNKELYNISIKMNNAQTQLAQAVISVIDGKHIKDIKDAFHDSMEISNKMSERFRAAAIKDWVDEPQEDCVEDCVGDNQSADTSAEQPVVYDITDGLDDRRQREMNYLAGYITWVADTYNVDLKDKMLTNVDIVRAGRYVANKCGNEVVKKGLHSRLKHFSDAFKNVVVSRT